MDKIYNSKNYEDKIYQKWEESGFFNPDNLNLPKNAPTYTIIFPPPNITAKLHMGHASVITIEDLMIRYHRMKGERTLWLPGTDHAAIATQNAVEKKIFKEQGLTRHDLGREKLLVEVWKFLKETQATILSQTRKMGASLDWSREAFTLDEQRKKAVTKMFVDMYEAGVIYRGERIVNWCPRCHSTLADDEVEYKDETAKLYWLKYGPFILATSRPETKLGDTAVAVHPDDERYKEMVGKKYMIPGVLGEFEIIVVADRSVDPEFGSGAIKVTPAHSFIDNEIAIRHNIAMKQIINEDGKMMENCGKYAGLTTKEAREAIVIDMEKLDLIDHIEDNYLHNIAVCYRCSTAIEPLPSKQWFVAVDKKIDFLNNKSLKEKAIEVAKNKEIKFIPERFEKRYLDWMENLHDWCISRQIWFGHQIPVWYCNQENKKTLKQKNNSKFKIQNPKFNTYVGAEAPKGDGWEQDPDTLDTWFSSGMWTFSTLGWPDNFKNGGKMGDLAKFHPTQVLETCYEILTLWVSRMIMMSLFAVQEIPFENVYLNGAILDKNGKKMSKSKGNGIDPTDMVEKFGADAVRLSMLIGNTPGNDARISEEKIAGFRNFINKLWNISRFIIQQSTTNFQLSTFNFQLSTADKWILNKFNNLIKEVDDDLEKYNFSQVGEKLREFTWNDFADWYLEVSKFEKNEEKNKILIYILSNLLKLWHPFIPFVTEVIWKEMGEQKFLMIEKWPSQLPVTSYQLPVTNNFEIIKNIIIAIRNARSENKIEPDKKIKAIICAGKNIELIEQNKELIKNLKTNINELGIKKQGCNPCKNSCKNDKIIRIAVDDIEIYLIGGVDEEKEKARIDKKIIELEKLILNGKKKLSNKEFISKAPEQIVKQEKEKLKLWQTELNSLK